MSPIHDIDVVVVGGGPMGLITANLIQIHTKKKVAVLEKYKEYQRSDIYVKLAAGSLKGMHVDPKLNKLAKQWGNHTVSIKHIEESLTKRANELGITILRGFTADPKKLPTQFPNAKLFIGADGAKSTMRPFISGENYKFNHTHQYLIQVQYIVEPPKKERAYSSIGESSYMIQDFSDRYRSQKFSGHLINETIRPLPDGTSRVTLQIFIDKTTFEEMSGATFKNPYYFDKDLNKVPEKLKDILIKWWGTREASEGRIIQDSEKKNKITVIALGSLAAKDLVKVDAQGRVWSLVGDAAMYFPFFRAINNGFLLSAHLAKCAAKAFTTNSFDSSSFKTYKFYSTWRAYVEFITASVKNLFINLSKLWIDMSRQVPWEINKYNDRQKEMYYKKGLKIWNRISTEQIRSKES